MAQDVVLDYSSSCLYRCQFCWFVSYKHITKLIKTFQIDFRREALYQVIRFYIYPQTIHVNCTPPQDIQAAHFLKLFIFYKCLRVRTMFFQQFKKNLFKNASSSAPDFYTRLKIRHFPKLRLGNQLQVVGIIYK